MPHMSDASTWTIRVIQPGQEICSWINDLGGATVISSLDLFALVQSFVNQEAVTGYSFIPTSLEIFGCTQYWVGNIPAGNNNTGCDY